METGANTVGKDKRGRFTKERYGDWGELSLKGYEGEGLIKEVRR